MDDAPACFSCYVGRKLRDISPAAPDYEIRAFEYPQCGTVLRVVFRCESSSDA